MKHWLERHGKENIRQHFPITREIKDHLLMFLTLEHKEDVIYL